MVAIDMFTLLLTVDNGKHFRIYLRLVIVHFFLNHIKTVLKVALQILGRTFYKNTKKSSLYSKSLLILIHKPQ